MRIAIDSESELILTSGTLVLSAVCGLLAAGCVGAAITLRAPALLVIAGALALVAILLMRFSSRVTFDKRARTVRIDQRRWFRRSGVSLAFAEITDVVMELGPRTGKRQQFDPARGRICLSARQGSLRLTDLYDTDLSRDPDRQAILAALGRPLLQMPRDEPVLRLVRAGRIIDAVEHLRSQEKLDLTRARARVAEMERQVALDEQRPPSNPGS